MKYILTLILLCLIAVADDASALESRYAERNQNVYSGRLISTSRYNLRRRPNNMVNVAPRKMLDRIVREAQPSRPKKTELVIKPFEYYNDAPIAVAAPIVEPVVKPVVTAKKIVLVNQNIEIKEEIREAPKLVSTNQKPVAKIALNDVDFSQQPLQIEEVQIIKPAKKLSTKEPIIKEVIATPQPKPAPVVPVVIEQNIVSEPPKIETTEPQATEISAQSKNILQKLPYDIFPEKRTNNANFDVSRTKKQGEVDATAAQEIGASVAVRRQSFDVNYVLDKAYNSLISGNTESAVQIYREVLAAEPNNKYALFGLATTYHKLGMAEQARPVYGRLLELDPYNKEALNNFLALVGEESPEQAILYLEQLKTQNSDFSPIYAQLAGLYLKQNNNPLAIENMQEAVAISPENLVYKYNLAVMYDKAKQPERAATLYRALVKSGLDGEELPANLQDIQKRLTFLSSNL